MKYWAYKHIDGGIHLKTYRADLLNARTSVDDAYESDFVDKIVEPFEAASRADAKVIAKQRLSAREVREMGERKRKLSKAQLLEKLERCAKSYDTESAHCDAGVLLVEYIDDEEIAEAYNKIDRSE